MAIYELSTNELQYIAGGDGFRYKDAYVFCGSERIILPDTAAEKPSLGTVMSGETERPKGFAFITFAVRK